MLQNMMTPELMDAMSKLQEAMKKMDPDKLSQALENFEFNLEEFEAELDRFIDMFDLSSCHDESLVHEKGFIDITF